MLANRVLSLKTGEPIIAEENKPQRIKIDTPTHQSNVYAELKWNSDGTLSALTIAEKTYHFVWNADGTLHSIRKG